MTLSLRRWGWSLRGVKMGLWKRLSSGAIVCAMAAHGRHLEMLKWACVNGCEWDLETCMQAAKGGHLHVLKRAWGNGGECDYDTCAKATSISGQQWDTCTFWSGHVITTVNGLKIDGIFFVHSFNLTVIYIPVIHDASAWAAHTLQCRACIKFSPQFPLTIIVIFL